MSNIAEKLRLPAAFRPEDQSLHGRQILITGASRGLGREIARQCAAAGAQTVLLARSVPALESLADEILAAGHPEPVLVPCNLEAATLEHYEEIATLLGDRFGHLDGLVVNAAMLGELSPIAASDPALWARVFQVNLHSPYLLVRSCLPLLRRASDARVLFVSSSVARQGRAYWGAYAASKAALENLMQVLADELAAEGIVRVNSVNPGRCRTEMRAQAYPAEDADRLPSPESLAPGLLYLLGEAASGLHGRQFDLQ